MVKYTGRKRQMEEELEENVTLSTYFVVRNLNTPPEQRQTGARVRLRVTCIPSPRREIAWPDCLLCSGAGEVAYRARRSSARDSVTLRRSSLVICSDEAPVGHF
jgi:hypothetical protein